jgi:valyl-tRNA synthetase
MDKAYDHHKYEEEIYKLWENSGAFRPNNKGVPYTILMPPPNANASLHAGHAMYTIDDIMTRWKRMQGFSAVWIPGTDHAGFETQYVYEKFLAKEGKSRMDFDRQTLYQNIYDFVKKNSGLIFNQFRRLGFSADWSRSVFTLNPQVVETVFETFKEMEKQGKVYRDNYMVNYCTHCGTSLSELEVDHKERTDPLYYIKYGPFVLATVRPETKFGDTAVAVHPKDKRYSKWVGQEIEVEGLLGKFTVKVIADDVVDRNFGTGAVKVTPAHDPNDFEMGKRHGLEIKQVIGLNGRLNEKAGKYAGLKVAEARKIVAEDMQKAGLMEKIDANYVHTVTVCYKCGRDLEPMVVPNWFIKVEELKKPVIEAVKKNKVKFFPARFKLQMNQWLKVMHDWPISRQVVWGIRIPVWYEIDLSKNNIWAGWLDKSGKFQQGYINEILNNGTPLSEIENGLQKVQVKTGAEQPKYLVAEQKPNDGKMYIPETDTFDTWFSSGQWPLVTLKEEEYKSRFPTDFMGTLSDILPFWISRMIMFSLYKKQEVPFKQVYLWSKVTDAKGQKMSKSKGNVVNPVELIDKYGADAVRMALIFGVAPGSNIPFSEEKIRGMRNFANKIWNMGRFIKMAFDEYGNDVPFYKKGESEINNPEDKKILKDLDEVIQKTTKGLEKLRFADATEAIYEFTWHNLADKYLEQIKNRKNDLQALMVARHVYFNSLRLLHPFMPFVTEAVQQEINNKRMLITAKWPEVG